MLEYTEWATGVDRDAGRLPHLPDLTTVDLRTLRSLDHPGLAAAVERVLRRPAELAESWVEGGGHSP
ncbi:hypothetical protein [Streptomyces sp. NPDC053755]|uniref:hypothetical protein n=1 Tax=Streptomyces sp. NPDC053755 TaxID=3155815 RepID=UPI00342D77EB